jgi:hypothetical protein
MPGFAAFHVGIQTDPAVVDDTKIDAARIFSEGGYVDGMSE